MASVSKNKRSGNWIAKFKDETGRYRRWSTKTKVKAEALRIAFQFEDDARHERRGAPAPAAR